MLKYVLFMMVIGLLLEVLLKRNHDKLSLEKRELKSFQRRARIIALLLWVPTSLVAFWSVLMTSPGIQNADWGNLDAYVAMTALGPAYLLAVGVNHLLERIEATRILSTE